MLLYMDIAGSSYVSQCKRCGRERRAEIEVHLDENSFNIEDCSRN
jgi:uncharacterized metal-binding protein YceD (DUF177 family)